MNVTQAAVKNAIGNLSNRINLKPAAIQLGQKKAELSLVKGSSAAMAVSIGFKKAKEVSGVIHVS